MIRVCITLLLFGVSLFGVSAFSHTHTPPLLPNTFSISFTTNSSESSGMMYYNWNIPAQRVDHGNGAYECLHFYNTSNPCHLYFLADGLWADLPVEKNCFLDVPGLGPLEPDWLTNSTYLGQSTVASCGMTEQWTKPPEPIHFWNTIPGNIPCMATFVNATQTMQFDISTWTTATPDASVFQLPSYCQKKKK